MKKIVWFGAGMMGSGFVEALRRRGDEVRVWNRTPEKARALERFGAVAVSDPREALRGAERAHVILSDDAAVDALLERIADAIPEGIVTIDHTTVAPRPTAARFEWCSKRGIEFLHAPVFMGPQACRESTGLMLCAGPRATLAGVEDELKKMTGTLWYLGERPEKAATFKLLGNAMLVTMTAGLADGYAMVRAAGISPQEAHELFSRFKPTGMLDVRGKAMAEGRFSPASFELSMARKDARLMLETAEAGGMQLHLLPAIAKWMDEMLAAGHANDDMGVLAASR